MLFEVEGHERHDEDDADEEAYPSKSVQDLGCCSPAALGQSDVDHLFVGVRNSASECFRAGEIGRQHKRNAETPNDPRSQKTLAVD